MIHYNKIVYGATLKGLAIAARSPGDTLIVEPSNMVAHEYASALRFHQCTPKALVYDFSADLMKELTTRNAINNGIVYVPVLPPIVMKLIKERGIHIVFSSLVLSIKQQGALQVVTTLFQHQTIEYTCNSIIDTTTDFHKLSAKQIPYTSSIGAILFEDSNSLSKIDSITKIGIPSLYLLQLPVTVDKPFDSHREKVIAYVSNLQKSYPNVKLLHIADTLNVCSKTKQTLFQEETGIYAPSCSGLSIIDSVEEGGWIGGMWDELINDQAK